MVYILEGDDPEAYAELVKGYAEDHWELSGEAHLVEEELGGLPTERELYA